MSGDTAASPVIPVEILFPLLTEHFLDAQAAPVFEHNNKSQTLQFRGHYIY
jgi:hypothetical protein